MYIKILILLSALLIGCQESRTEHRKRVQGQVYRQETQNIFVYEKEGSYWLYSYAAPTNSEVLPVGGTWVHRTEPPLELGAPIDEGEVGITEDEAGNPVGFYNLE